MLQWDLVRFTIQTAELAREFEEWRYGKSWF